MFKLKTRIALTYCVFIAITVAILFMFFNIALKNNLNRMPLIEKIYPSGLYVTIHEIPENNVELPRNILMNPNNLQKVNTNTVQLDKLIVNELSKRLMIISLITIIFILIIAFYLSRYLSKLAMKPLDYVTKAVNNISPDNLDLNIDLEKVKADKEMVKLVTAYNSTTQKLKRTFADLQQFNSYASHELRNSLAVLKAKIEIGTENKELDKYVDKVKETVNDMLILSSKQMKNKYELVDLALVAALVVDEYSVTGRKIELDIPEEGVSLVQGNEIWLHRSICNLLDNAIKYSDKESPIYVYVKEQNNTIILSVKDFGIGISKEEQENIWNPYYSNNSSKNVHGIGLALINNVVDLCGGMVLVDSEEGKGSTFYISLPVSLS